MDEEEKQLSIKINIADRYYPFKIKATGEENIRLAAKRVNEILTQHRQRYVNRDTQDVLSIAALEFMLRIMAYEEMTDVSPWKKAVEDLDRQLAGYLEAIAVRANSPADDVLCEEIL